MLQTPRGFLALSFVQLGTLLLNGQRRRDRYRIALADLSDTRCPNTSASGCIGLFTSNPFVKASIALFIAQKVMFPDGGFISNPMH
jgi:hypothetical protein